MSKKRTGRPPRAAASAKALAGIDPSAVDPWHILRLIAADSSAPASARVSAARALLTAPAVAATTPADDEAREWRRLVGPRGGKA